MDLEQFAELAKWTVIAGGSLALLPAAYRAARQIYDDVYARMLAVWHDRLTLAHIATQNKLNNVRAITPDERGRLPLLYGENGILRDPNNLRAFTLQAVSETYPQLERLDWAVKTLIAMQGVHAGNARQADALIEPAALPPSWPAEVTIDQVLSQKGIRPSINDLVVGIYPTGDHDYTVVRKSLHQLMHTLLVGVTGKGKSVWLSMFLYQIAKAPEACEILAIDLNGSEFNILRQWDRLRYPVARTDRDAIAQLDQVGGEIERRRAMYEHHPLVTKLDEYNEATGAGLPPWVVCIDEGTNLLNQKGIGESLRVAVQCARQYGIYILLAGQSAKHSVIDTQVRDNFPTRLCFKTSPTSTRVVLGENPPHPLEDDPGRAWAQLSGGADLLEIKGAMCARERFYQLLKGNGPRMSMPEYRAENAGHTDEQINQVLEMYRAGESKRAIQRGVFGYEGGAAYTQVNDILEKFGGTTGTGTTEAVQEAETGSDREPADSTSPDWCEFCDLTVDDAPDGTLFTSCPRCGVAVCSHCMQGGLCPDCGGKQ